MERDDRFKRRWVAAIRAAQRAQPLPARTDSVGSPLTASSPSVEEKVGFEDDNVFSGAAWGDGFIHPPAPHRAGKRNRQTRRQYFSYEHHGGTWPQTFRLCTAKRQARRPVGRT